MATMASLSSVTASEPGSYHPPRPRKFAPLNPQKVKAGSDGDGHEDGGLPLLRGIIFDVDGTLCLPQNYMFKQMRDALQIPKSVDILDHVRSLSDEPDQSGSGEFTPRSRATEAIRDIERTAMTSQEPQPGLAELMTYLDSRKLLKGLCTRNFPAPVEHLIKNFITPHGISFKPEEVITRETTGIAPKPSPEGIWSIAKYWSTTHPEIGAASVQEKSDGADEEDALDIARKYLGSGLIMVGDSVDDMAAGYRAGAATVLLLNQDNEWLAEHEYTDLAVKRLDDLVQILEDGFVGNVSL